MISLEEFETYQMADAISDKIWNHVISWNYFAKDTIGKQLTRAADSISANLAEGYGRYFYKENKQFCYYGRGSLLEAKNWMQKSIRRNLIPETDGKLILEELDIIHKKLNAYIKYIGSQTKTNDK